MQINGYQLREALRRWHGKREVAEKQFNESLWVFDGDSKESLEVISTRIFEANAAIAKLEALQQRFNLDSSFKLVFPDGTIQEVSLSLAVKFVGSAGRQEKMWRKAAMDTGKDSYSYRNNERSKESEYAKKAITDIEAMELADKYAKFACGLRSSIAMANNGIMEVDEGYEQYLI